MSRVRRQMSALEATSATTLLRELCVQRQQEIRSKDASAKTQDCQRRLRASRSGVEFAQLDIIRRCHDCCVATAFCVELRARRGVDRCDTVPSET